MSLRMLYLASRKRGKRSWTPRFIEALEARGELRIEEETASWEEGRAAALCREYDLVFTDWSSRRLPESLAEEPGRLRYVCNLSGSIRGFVPRSLVEAGLLVSNWGPLPALRVAEGALTLLLTSLKGIVPQHEAQRRGHWGMPEGLKRGSVHKLRVGIYGLGVIGQALVNLLRLLQPRMTGFDPFLESWPEDVARASSLEALFEASEAVLITAALTGETRRSVGARHLGKLVDGGIVINVARGAIIDQEALFAELENGRLRAGLDVLDTDGRDWVPEDHPCRQWTNLLLTAHVLSAHPWNSDLYEKDSLSQGQEIALGNVDRFIRGEPVNYSFDLIRYDRST